MLKISYLLIDKGKKMDKGMQYLISSFLYCGLTTTFSSAVNALLTTLR